MNRNIVLLSTSFFLIFLGMQGIQQYVTVFFQDIGIVATGYYSLMFIYLSFILFNSPAAMLITRYGSKKGMLLGALTMPIYILLLLSNNRLYIYFGSCFVGAGSALLWIGQKDYLIKESNDSTYGKNAGFFATVFMLGCCIGVLLLGYLITVTSLRCSFALFAVFPVCGLILIISLPNKKGKSENINTLVLMRKSISNVTLLKLSTFGFTVAFVQGLIIGVIPIEIKKTMGIAYIGLLTSLYYILSILFSYAAGVVSDKIGRKSTIIISYLVLLCALVLFFFSYITICLIVSILLIGLNFAIANPLFSALIGDIGTEKNRDFIIALFLMMQNVGIVLSFLLSGILYSNTLFVLTLLVTLVSLMMVSSEFKLSLSRIRTKLNIQIH